MNRQVSFFPVTINCAIDLFCCGALVSTKAIVQKKVLNYNIMRHHIYLDDGTTIIGRFL